MMHRLLRLLRPRLGFRRVIAAALACTVLGSVAEPVIAEAHDGDALGSTVGAGVTTSALAQRIERSAVDTGNTTRAILAATAVSARDTAADSTAQPTPPSAPNTPDQGSHSAHVCHCAHVHGGALAGRVALAPPSDRAVTARPRSDRLPPSVAAEPHLRPPLSPLAA